MGGDDESIFDESMREIEWKAAVRYPHLEVGRVESWWDANVTSPAASIARLRPVAVEFPSKVGENAG